MSNTVSEDNRIKAEEIKAEANKLFAGKKITFQLTTTLVLVCKHTCLFHCSQAILRGDRKVHGSHRSEP